MATKELWEPTTIIVPVERLPALQEMVGKVNLADFRGWPPRSVLIGQMLFQKASLTFGRKTMMVELRFVPVHEPVGVKCYDAVDFAALFDETDEPVIVSR